MPDDRLQITNCHVHLFTIDHIPRLIAGTELLSTDRLRTGLARNPGLIGVFSNLAKLALRISPRLVLWLIERVSKLDAAMIDRLVRFADVSVRGEQREVFRRLQVYYPTGARFVVLPMDMAAMGRGAPRAGIDAQHRELIDLAHAPETAGTIVPFAAVDPRRRDALARLERYHRWGCRGLKIYPPLGYLPDHPRLMDELYPYCEAHGLPVMTHCSRGGAKGRVTGNEIDTDGETVVAGRGMLPDEAAGFADPSRYLLPLVRFPRLRFCLAHFGGETDWRMYFEAETREERWPEHFSDLNWLAKLLHFIKSGDYPNLWTDISYTIFHFEKYHRALRVFLSDETLRSRVLFGSDFYMAEIEEFRERDLSMSLRAELGEAWFRQIAMDNPAAWLGER